MKRLTGGTMAVLLGAVLALAAENPHPAASGCRLNFHSGCDRICLTCHKVPTEAEPYAGSVPAYNSAALGGDLQVCLDCHSDYASAGNHPVGIPYDPFRLRADYVSAPEGLPMPCNLQGGSCLLVCSTCHDPHGELPSLLRKSLAKSALCVTCHIR